MSTFSDHDAITPMDVDDHPVPPDAPSEPTRDETRIESLTGKQKHNLLRKNAWEQDVKSRRANKYGNGRVNLPAAQLPSSVQPEVRQSLKATKAMVLLTSTVKEFFPAQNLAEALVLQGSHGLDGPRIQAFVSRLFRSAKTCRSSYPQTDDNDEIKNQEFYKAVSDDIRAKGMVGGGLGQASHTINVSPKTCQAFHELFVNGRKAYLRDLVESEEMREGSYTKKMKELIEAVDYWMRFLTKDEETRRGVAEDNEMFNVFNDVAL
ncbi:hypothetical protein BDP81DRAFT_517389 [Colletotrichum phormii]|uniref:Uncharacterized protein n=1 Tax=Colletotrichum phormii TaxID=359342 RepID=A0AAI9ZTC1_9PEZI|nr:uncharacterized protein BDP81DRAFT_517389 [Colletotrichum phormii]KAK1637738.1 hypothetical protein BDP81DRAFT_517389 [Colletotrichum phormii]